MKGLSRGNSIFRKKNKEPVAEPVRSTGSVQEEPETSQKKNITINLTLNLNLDKDQLAKAMNLLDIYSDIVDDSSSYTQEYRYNRN